MKTKAQINRWIRQLKAIVKENENKPPAIEARIAWLEWHLLRRIVEDGIVGWPNVVADLRSTATLIEQELRLKKSA